MLLQLGYKASTSLQDQLDKVRVKFTWTSSILSGYKSDEQILSQCSLTLSTVLTGVKVDVKF